MIIDIYLISYAITGLAITTGGFLISRILFDDREFKKWRKDFDAQSKREWARIDRRNDRIMNTFKSLDNILNSSAYMDSDELRTVLAETLMKSIMAMDDDENPV